MRATCTDMTRKPHAHLGLRARSPIPSRAAAPAPNRSWPHSTPEHINMCLQVRIHAPQAHNLRQHHITEAIALNDACIQSCKNAARRQRMRTFAWLAWADSNSLCSLLMFCTGTNKCNVQRVCINCITRLRQIQQNHIRMITMKRANLTSVNALCWSRISFSPFNTFA